MGNDGGSIPDRRDLVKTKAKAEQADKANQTKARWFFCALSKKRLQEPIVSCPLGKLYNKDAIIEYLLDKSAYGDGEEICGHIRSLKDVKTLKLTPNGAASPNDDNSAQFMCPLTLREMNGVQPFVYISTCGCVFSQAGLRTVSGSADKDKGKQKEKEASSTESPTPPADDLDLCPQCGTKYSKAQDVITLNPSEEEEQQLKFALELKRASEPTKKKGKKRKQQAEADGGEPEPPSKKKHQPSINPSVGAASKAVLEGLAAEEAKRKANMSEAVKSLYGDGKPARKETFMTMGTFTRYA